MKNKHKYTLEKLVNAPKILFDEKPTFVLPEARIYKPHSRDLAKFCDIIYGFKDYGVPVEVKSNYKYRDRATEQLESSAKWMYDTLKLPAEYGIIAYYSKGFVAHKINLMNGEVMFGTEPINKW